MKRVHIIVTGTVQGVGFRYATKAEAERLGVTGWVRNVGSDRVEAEVQGDDDRVDEMQRWLQHGPPYAAVERINVGDAAIVDGEERFRILRTE
ncbi:acylphosphatase [Microbacterium faecale]|uniref:acylphosphatase n=1 Tax=Microbacterium faecale TaxID=1804630 RepID=A0A916Y6N1_9MICO|nr:acylphosphatase [Microbacterium faecale]GGD32204.1 acylphosphatase [Microbacterium faecale]